MRLNFQVDQSKIFSILFMVFFAMSSQVSALTVDEAYRAIPHQQTVFLPNESRMPDEDKKFLVQFFGLIDQAMVARVDLLMWLNSNGRQGSSANHYDEVFEQLDALEVPSKFKNLFQLIYEAIQDQKIFLEDWKASRKPMDIRTDAKVQSSSQKLRQAYQLLMELYPQETPHNKSAFFDYLCALDFI